MTNEEIAVKLAQLEQHIKSNAHRLDDHEEQLKVINQLARSTDRLAQNMETMTKEQERQGKQIDALETSRTDMIKYWLRTILAAVATGVIGYALASVLTK